MTGKVTESWRIEVYEKGWRRRGWRGTENE